MTHTNATSRSLSRTSTDARPIFILSGHRTGSTLLRYLLDSHSRLACPPESKFIAQLEHVIESPPALGALATLGISRAELASELRLLVERIMGRYAQRANKPRWVDKTPNYYRLTHVLEFIFARQAQYIVLVRHPLDCIASLEAYFDQSPHHADPDIARSAATYGVGRYAWAQYWLDVYTRLHAFAASCPDRSLIVRYEDLTGSPPDALRRILTFVGEDYEPDMVTTAFTMRHTLGFGDRKIRSTTGVHQDSIGQWMAWPRPEIDVLWNAVRPLATTFGYGIDGD